MKVKILPVFTDEQVNVVAALADEIIHEFYGKTMDVDHLSFFIAKYQSPKAITEQIQGSLAYFTIEIDGNAQGYIAIEYKGDVALLSKLYIRAIYRQSGVGSVAIDFVKSEVIQKKITRLELFVSEKNSKGISFYLKHGFTKVRKCQRNYGDGQIETDLLMELKPT